MSASDLLGSAREGEAADVGGYHVEIIGWHGDVARVCVYKSLVINLRSPSRRHKSERLHACRAARAPGGDTQASGLHACMSLKRQDTSERLHACRTAREDLLAGLQRNGNGS